LNIIQIDLKKLQNLALILILIIAFSFYGYNIFLMWNKGYNLTKDGNTSLNSYVETSKWLSKNLKQNETALVPAVDVFYVLNSSLSSKIRDYRIIWNASGVILKADTNSTEVAIVRSNLITYLNNSDVKYLVKDWVSPYSNYIFNADIDDDLFLMLKKVKIFRFRLSTGWSASITIYEKIY